MNISDMPQFRQWGVAPLQTNHDVNCSMPLSTLFLSVGKYYVMSYHGFGQYPIRIH